MQYGAAFLKHKNSDRKPQHAFSDEFVQKIVKLKESELYKDANVLMIHFDLHGGIDDSTGKIVGLHVAKNECLHGYFEVTKQIIRKNGVPVSIYADCHAIFLPQNASKLSIEDQLAGKIVNDTQFGRAMKELGITLLSTYIDKFNQQFSVEPEDAESAFRVLPPAIDLDTVLCVKITRTVDNGGVFSLYNRNFKVLENQSSNILHPRKSKIYVLISPVFGIKAQYEKTTFDVINYIKPIKVTTPSKPKEKKPWTPPDSHYYKYGHTLMKKLNYEESDQEILRILEDIFLKRYA